MADKKIKWTTQQSAAITERDRNVLVTASAGTGKTAVLSGRCVDVVADKNICPDIWSILVLTFTDAAAEQMRERIAKQLTEAYKLTQAPHLKYQLTLLPGADISTIHSFCKRLLTEHFHTLGLDPAFGIVDEDQQRLLKANALQQTIDWAWEQDDLGQSLRELFKNRKVTGKNSFLQNIIDISNHLESVICKEKWFADAVEMTETGKLGVIQKQIIAKRLNAVLEQLNHALRIYQQQDNDGKWASKLHTSHINVTENLLRILNDDNWPRFAEAINSVGRLTVQKPKDINDLLAETLQEMVRNASVNIKAIKDLAILNPDYLDQVKPTSDRQIKVLVELTKQFEQFYERSKSSINRLDFADLERFTLNLLTKNIEAEKLEPSDTALTLRRRYKFIFVDEYQDINPVQKQIIELISGQNNIFVVGDVKQSIYAFRGAQPQIFVDDLKLASTEPKQVDQPRRVDLNKNFRSAEGVLDFVNHIFARIMSEPMAGIEYDDSAMLRPGLEKQKAENPQVELHLLDSQQQLEDDNNESDEISVSLQQKQAAMIANRIKEIINSDNFLIYDKDLDTNRQVQYSDIVILMRSIAQKANNYVEILQLADIPVSCDSAAGFFEATEINDCLCLLKVLDNPQRDIELTSVLRSPLFKISESELTCIRLHNIDETCGFYSCLQRYINSGPDKKLKNKLETIMEQLQRWRSQARIDSIADLIWRIYSQSSMLAFVSALPNGPVRHANLLKLHDRAIQFEKFSSNNQASLSRFIQFIEKLQDQDVNWAGAEPEETAGNAVRIMSVHKSKGLEFPVVFLAELESTFNHRSINSDLLLAMDIPMGLKIIDAQKNKLSTVAHQILVEQKRTESLAEEMRILYVAMTRAKQRLILCGTGKLEKYNQLLTRGYYQGSDISSQMLSDSRRAIEWLLYGLSDRHELHTAFETELLQPKDEKMLDVNLYREKQLDKFDKFIQKLRKQTKQPSKKRSAKAGSQLLEKVKASVLWDYDFRAMTVTQAKQSVSQLTHQNDEFALARYLPTLNRQPLALMTDEQKTKTFDSGLVIGTATHLVISQLDLNNDVNKETVNRTIEELIASNNIDPEAAVKIDVNSIVEFFQTDLGKRALNKNNKIFREWQFTFTQPVDNSSTRGATSHEPRATDDEVIIQGIIDMLIETPQGLIIIDFKTDNIKGDSDLVQRTELYRIQLNTYTQAVATILNKPVISKYLYFLSISKAVEV